MRGLLDRIATLVVLPSTHPLLANEEWRTVYEQLFGGAAALSEAGTIIGQRIDGMDIYPTLVPKLGSILQEMLSNRAQVKWADEPFSLWSSGFFLNRAQANVVSCVDRALNLLITSAIPSIDAEVDLHGLWWQVRARLAGHLYANLSKDLGKFLNGYCKLGKLKKEAKKAKLSLWLCLATYCSDLDHPKEICTWVANHVTQAAPFLAISEQVNLFKHHPSGAAQDRRPSSSIKPQLAGLVSVVQWAVCLQAFELSVRLCKRFARTAVQQAASAGRAGSWEDVRRV